NEFQIDMEGGAPLVISVQANQHAWFTDMLAGESSREGPQFSRDTKTLPHNVPDGIRFDGDDEVEVTKLIHLSADKRARYRDADDTLVGAQNRQRSIEK